MSDGRITRSQGKGCIELQNEIEAFNPFISKDKIPMGSDPSLLEGNSKVKEIIKNVESDKKVIKPIKKKIPIWL